MSRYSRNKSSLRQIEGRHAVIEALLSNKKVSFIDLSDSNDQGKQIEKILYLAKEKNIKINFLSKKTLIIELNLRYFILLSFNVLIMSKSIVVFIVILSMIVVLGSIFYDYMTSKND